MHGGRSFNENIGKFKLDVNLSEAIPDDYDAIMIRGGVINSDLMLKNGNCVVFVTAFLKAGKPEGSSYSSFCNNPFINAFHCKFERPAIAPKATISFLTFTKVEFSYFVFGVSFLPK